VDWTDAPNAKEDGVSRRDVGSPVTCGRRRRDETIHLSTKFATVPRHSEINDDLAKKICKDLGIPLP
jgi:hypothetical protein